jgi:hypothetical protein
MKLPFPTAILLLSIALPRAEADPIRLTGGILSTGAATPLTRMFVDLSGPGFAYSNSAPDFDFFDFMSAQPPWMFPELQLAPGTAVEFDAFLPALLGLELDNFLSFGGQFYRATAAILIDTGLVPVGPSVTLPFTLVGSVHGCIPSVPEGCALTDATVDVSIVGSGTMHALFSEVEDSGLLQLEAVRYEVAPVLEPSTLLLLAGGVTALAARSRSRRSAG